MKKKYEWWVSHRRALKKMMLMTKLTTVLVLVFSVNVVASVYSQNTNLNLNMEQTSIKEVLQQIESQSDFRFIYENEKVNMDKKVSILVDNESVDQVLNKLFEGEGVSYTITSSNLIIIKPSNGLRANENLVQQQQQRTISGKVTDSSGEPLPGVTVLVKGTTQGAVTDFDGNYTISNVPATGTLVFSFVGMRSQEIGVGNQSTINVVMAEDAIGIDEVVAVGYGTMKKSDLTGSVSQIKSEDLNSYPTTNVQQAMAGKSPGVQVMQTDGSPGSPISIRIRGANSIRGDNEPLYVVDGFPTSNISILNNSDIESIEILKDASATAIYGSRAANGVVLITTRQGKEGTTSVDFESSFSSQSLIRKLDLMNANEYAQLYNIQAINDGLNPYFTESEVNSFGEGLDYQDLMFQNAPMLTNSLNINGGTRKTKFAISGSTLNQEGIIKNSDYNRYTIRTNIAHEFNKVFNATLSATNTRIITGRQDSGGGTRGQSLIGATQAAPPVVKPYNEDGTYTQYRSVYAFMELANPLNVRNEETNTIKANQTLINAALVFKPLDEISVRISGGYENRDDRSDTYQTRQYINSDGFASVGTNQYTSLLNENTINYTNTFNDAHNVSALAGVTYQDFVYTSLAAEGNGFLSDAFESFNLEASTVPGIPSSGYSKSVLLSYLGRINYNFKSKYYVTASYRADGSSKFSEGSKWGYFPSAALAWRVSEEDFLKDNFTISSLKIRASWGATGSQAISPYATLNMLNAGKTVFNDGLYSTFAPGTQLPGDLKWETTRQLDFGFDMGLLDNKFLLTADYYVKNTSDLLNTVVLPSSLGYNSTLRNVGEVQNKGFELGLETIVLDGDFKWDINANFSLNRNKVVKLYDGEDILGGYISTVTLQTNASILSEGRPIGQFYGFREDGYTDDGRIKYKDIDGKEGITNDDQTFIGDPNPDFIYGINSSMSYKNFELNIFFQGVYGNDLYNVSAAAYAADYGFGLNLIKEVLYDHWTPTNTNAKYPKISRSTTISGSDRFVEDGSYLRLKNIQLAYNLPVRNLGLNWLQSSQIYMSGQNLLTFTKYSGWDPEVNALGGAASTTPGVDHSRYPMTKSITFGIRVRF